MSTSPDTAVSLPVLTLPGRRELRLASARAIACVGAGSRELLAQLDGRSDTALILPDRMAPLHARLSLGRQLADAQAGTRRAARDRAIDLLELVGVPEPHRRVDARPHQLVTLDRQRAQLALALVNNPAVIGAEDPAAGLSPADLHVFGALCQRLRAQLGFALLITADQRDSVAPLVDEIIDIDIDLDPDPAESPGQASSSSSSPSST